MNAVRRGLKECNTVLIKVPFLKSLISNSKYIFAIGSFFWILGGLIPDTAHFAVTLFSSLGRAAIFLGLLFTLIKGDEDRFIMFVSIALCIGAFITIIVELAAAIYFASLESWLYLLLFFLLAVNSGKYIKNKWRYAEQDKVEQLMNFSDILSHTEDEAESSAQPESFSQDAPPIHVETLQRKTPTKPRETPAPPAAPRTKPESPQIKDSPAQSKAPEPAKGETSQEAAPKQSEQPSDSRVSTFKRVSSFGPVPSIGRAPSVKIKPEE